MMDLISDTQSSTEVDFSEEIEHLTKLYDNEPFTAFCEDLEFMWRWTIYQNRQLVQEGCSLTLDASRHAVGHVLAFYNVSVNRQGQGELK